MHACMYVLVMMLHMLKSFHKTYGVIEGTGSGLEVDGDGPSLAHLSLIRVV
jgi:hypothetical protein